MTLSDYNRWLTVARKHSRRQEEADDLLQDALLIAAEAGRLDFDVEENRRWFSGVLRNRAAMTARTEGRRKEREKRVGVAESLRIEEDVKIGDSEKELERTFSLLEGLAPASRRLATLILHGMTRQEIVFALNLSPTAYRQRLVPIRKYLSDCSQVFRIDMMALAYYRWSDERESLERGLIRQALLRSVHVRQEIGAHDPDGHLILFRSL